MMWQISLYFLWQYNFNVVFCYSQFRPVFDEDGTDSTMVRDANSSVEFIEVNRNPIITVNESNIYEGWVARSINSIYLIELWVPLHLEINNVSVYYNIIMVPELVHLYIVQYC